MRGWNAARGRGAAWPAVGVALVMMSAASVTSGQAVKLGIDELARQDFAPVAGMRVGLVAHPASRAASFEHSVEVLRGTDRCELVALFGPEHGVHGDAYGGDKIEDAVDARTGLPMYSLYGQNRAPTPEMLATIDALLIDLQDIGARSYTFISTMRACLEACAEADVPFVVLDRPNPLGGQRVEGPPLDPRFESFISYLPVPYVHGMTMGELAKLVQETYAPDYDKLTVVTMSGWKREMLWQDTGLRWVITSPHIPQASTCAYYVATGIVGELDSVSIGVGYTQPFELAGAPWVNGAALAEALGEHWSSPHEAYRRLAAGRATSGAGSPAPAGLAFSEVYFKPFYGRFQGEVCRGVQVYVDPRRAETLVEINYRIAEALGPDRVFGDASRVSGFDKASGSDEPRRWLLEGRDLGPLFARWREQADDFRQARQPYLLYE